MALLSAWLWKERAELVDKMTVMNLKRIAGAVLLLAVMVGCTSRPTNEQANGSDADVATEAVFTEKIVPEYAEGFEIRYEGKAALVDIHDPQSESAGEYHYALVRRGDQSTSIPEGYEKLEIPVRSVICMTSLQLSNFIKLGETERVTGITSTRHLFNETMNQQLKSGKTVKIGIEGNFNNEAVMSMNPDLILISPFKRGGYEALKDVGIPLVPHLGYKEMTPLGQAEWIKFVGLLCGMEKEANACFQTIEQRYNELKALTADGKVKRRPVVFSGELRGGNWYAVGGKSFLAQLFKDAGADYFLKDDERSGGVTLDFETVYNQADNADYWRIVNSYPGEFSYEALKEQDARYADFKAFREHGIIYCNMKTTPFYEEMPTAPEVILADLLHIFHPELLPDHKPVFYKLLKE